MNLNYKWSNSALTFCKVALFSLISFNALAFDSSGKILLTGGVSQIEGSAGGGLVPWAIIGGYETEDQIGFNAFHTNVNTSDYTLEAAGVLVGLYDRVELSYAKQSFNTQSVLLGLGFPQNFRIKQNVFGVKVKLTGDAVLEQDSFLPQIAVGAQYKQNEQSFVGLAIGAKDKSGYDYYISATKILLNQSLLYTVNLRATKANQLGILGYGGDKNENYQLRFEGSLAYLVCSTLTVGTEYRQKTDNLSFAKEYDWSDYFIAWAPTKNISLTLAYARLGSIVGQDDQNGLYSSVQIGF